MDLLAIIFDGLRIIFGFFLVLFLPGFTISLAYFPRLTDLSLFERLVYSTVLSIGSVMVLVLFMEFVLGVNTTPRNITLFICVMCELALGLWWCERWYRKRLKTRIDPLLAGDYRAVRNYSNRVMNSIRDRFRQNTRTVVVYHEDHQSELTHINHSYLLDVGEEIDIQQVIKNILDINDNILVQPPYPRTRYFELVIREYKEEGLSLVDDLQIYPVLVTKNPDIKFLGFSLKRGITNITERIHKKADMTEIQWIYSHDFHIFAIIHAEDTLDQMVDRIMGKLDEITLSIKGGIHDTPHGEDWLIFRSAFDAIIGKSRDIPAKPPKIAQVPEVPLSDEQRDLSKRLEFNFSVIRVRKLQKEILRNMDVFNITSESFGKSKKNIENIKIPKNSDINKELADVEEEIQDPDWHYL